MLQVDLGELERHGRVLIDATLAIDDPLWQGAEFRLREPLQVEGEAQLAGEDVVVRATLYGAVEAECRRCLEPVTVPLEEELTLLFRPGLDPVEAEEAELYPLPERSRELDLSGPIREHVLLAAPSFVLCRDDCRGLCPHCGKNHNREECDCAEEVVDARWNALRDLRLD